MKGRPTDFKNRINTKSLKKFNYQMGMPRKYVEYKVNLALSSHLSYTFL